MPWDAINPLELTPGGRILESLIKRMRDNYMAAVDQSAVGVPAAERARIPECFRTNESIVTKALASGGPGAAVKWLTTPIWKLAAFQTPGAWNLAGGVGAREYMIEMWGGGGGGDGNAGRRGGGSGAYIQIRLPVGAGVAIGGSVGAAGTGAFNAAGGAGGNTTLTIGPGTATAYGAAAGGAGGILPIFGGTSALIFRSTGHTSDTLAVGGTPIGTLGVGAPFIGGASWGNGGTVPTACGGTASLGAGVGTPQPGGAGMVLVWYLE